MHLLAFYVITFIVSARGNLPDVREGLPPTIVETIPLSEDGIGLTVSWGTKFLTFKDKDDKGKDIIGEVEVLSISSTVTGNLVNEGLYFTYAMLDKQLILSKWDSFVCGTQWTAH